MTHEQKVEAYLSIIATASLATTASIVRSIPTQDVEGADELIAIGELLTDLANRIDVLGASDDT